VLVTGASTDDSVVFAAPPDDLPPVRTPAGRRRLWVPHTVLASILFL
jgi:hypothetical protein